MSVETQRSKPVSWGRAIRRILLGGLVVTVFGLVVAVSLFPPSGSIRLLITDAVAAATGRAFSFSGDPSLSFNPRPVLTLQRAALAGPAGVPGPETVRAERIDVQINPLALFTGRIGLDHITVTRAAMTVRPEDAAIVARLSQAAGGRVGVAEVRLVDSAVNYLVTHPNPAWRIDQVSMTVRGLSGVEPVQAQGRLRWRGEIVELDGSLESLAALGSEAGSPFKLAASSRRASATLDGRLAPNAPSLLVATMQAKAGSARDALRWLSDINLGARALAGPATLDGPVAIAGNEARLDGVTVKLDAGEGRIELRLLSGGAKPQVSGRIAWQDLDLVRLIGEAPVAPAAAAALEARSRDKGPVIESAWASLADDLARIEAATTGSVAASADNRGAKQAAWSTQPLDLSALDAVDVELESSAATVRYGRIDVRNSSSRLVVKEGRLAWDVASLEIAGGRATGKLGVDGTQKPARVTVEARATDVPAESVLAQLFKSLLLSGKTKLDVGLEGRGRTPQELMSSLAGQADVRIENGAFHGFDLRRSLLTWWQSHPFDPAKKTTVARIDGKFALRDGVLRTAAPLTVDGDVRISAEGTVQIAQRAMDQNIRVRVAPPPEHLAIPVRVTGSWTAPKIAWDWRAIFESGGSLGSPMAVETAAEPVPPEVRAAIARVLQGPGAAALEPAARQMLEALQGG